METLEDLLNELRGDARNAGESLTTHGYSHHMASAEAVKDMILAKVKADQATLVERCLEAVSGLYGRKGDDYWDAALDDVTELLEAIKAEVLA